MSATKQCTCCGQVKPLSDFGKNNSASDGKQSKCSVCMYSYNKQRRDELNTYRKTVTNRKKVSYLTMGVLYLIGTGDEADPIKIGKSVGKLNKRVANLQTGNWKELKVLWQVDQVEDVLQVEASLHKKYKDKHVRGEWFNLNAEDVKDIISAFKKPTTED